MYLTSDLPERLEENVLDRFSLQARDFDDEQHGQEVGSALRKVRMINVCSLTHSHTHSRTRSWKTRNHLDY